MPSYRLDTHRLPWEIEILHIQYIQHSEDTPFTMEMKRNWIQSRVLGTGVQYATAYLRYLLTKETKINLID